VRVDFCKTTLRKLYARKTFRDETAVELTWHIQDIQGQILAFAPRQRSSKHSGNGPQKNEDLCFSGKSSENI
jgi:hypothetical protein